MANVGVIIVSVAFAAIVAVGTVIFNAYQQRQQEYEYKNQSHGFSSASNERASKQKGLANCSRCSFPLSGLDIVRMRCNHIFHSDCIKMDDTCPLGCRM